MDNNKLLKIFVVQESKGKIGGGWTFIDNLYRSTEGKLEYVLDPMDADLFFIPSATMVTKKYVRDLKERYHDRPFVLRVDNLPPNHRNSGEGWSRLVTCADAANLIIFQSEWAKNHIAPILLDNIENPDKETTIIYNGVDIFHFNPDGKNLLDKEVTLTNGITGKLGEFSPRFLFYLSSSDPTKRIEEAIHLFREYSARMKKSSVNPLLIFAGKGYPKEYVDYNFEFTNDENILYLPDALNRDQSAQLYRSVDGLIFPAYGNACSNTVLEAMASGINVLYQAYGGQDELLRGTGIRLEYTALDAPVYMLSELAKTGEWIPNRTRSRAVDNFSLEKMALNYIQAFKSLL